MWLVEHNAARVGGQRRARRGRAGRGGRRAAVHLLRAAQEPHLHTAIPAEHARHQVRGVSQGSQTFSRRAAAHLRAAQEPHLHAAVLPKLARHV